MDTFELFKMVIEIGLTIISSGLGSLIVFKSAFSKAFTEEKASRVAARRFDLYDELLAQVAEMQLYPARIFDKNYIHNALILRAKAQAYASEDVRGGYDLFFRFISDTNRKFKSDKDELWSSFFEEGDLLGFDDCGDPVLEDRPLYSGADRDYRTALTALHEESLPTITSIYKHTGAIANAIHDEYEKQRGRK